jgi:hypothetical protein
MYYRRRASGNTEEFFLSGRDVSWWLAGTSMVATAAITVALSRLHFTGNDSVVFAKTALITASGTTAAWILATLLTHPEPEAKLIAFYRRVHPTVYGWRPIADKVPELPPVRDLAANGFNWALGCVFVYASLFGIGKMILGELKVSLPLLLVAAVSASLMFWHLSRRGWQTLSGNQSDGNPMKLEEMHATRD